MSGEGKRSDWPSLKPPRPSSTLLTEPLHSLRPRPCALGSAKARSRSGGRLFGSYAHGWHTQLFQELQVQWLDRWLKGESNGAETAAKVMLFVKGADRWRLEDDWPLPDAHATPL